MWSALVRIGGLWLVLCLLFDSRQPAVAADRIYRCEVDGKITYSDSGCTPAAKATEVVATRLNTYESEPVAAARAAQKHPNVRARNDSIALDQERAKLKCQRLADRLLTLEVKMRAGHSLERGERLREQKRQLEQQQRTEKCR